MALNFLPTDNQRSQQVLHISSKLKYLGAALAAICLAIGIGGTAMILIKSASVSKLTSQEETLKTQVIAEESTEQTLVLYRDRLKKIRDVQEKYKSSSTLEIERAFIEVLPSGVVLKKLGLNEGAASLTLVSPESASLEAAIALVRGSSLVSPTIESLTFNIGQGFNLDIAAQ